MSDKVKKELLAKAKKVYGRDKRSWEDFEKGLDEFPQFLGDIISELGSELSNPTLAREILDYSLDKAKCNDAAYYLLAASYSGYKNVSNKENIISKEDKRNMFNRIKERRVDHDDSSMLADVAYGLGDKDEAVKLYWEAIKKTDEGPLMVSVLSSVTYKNRMNDIELGKEMYTYARENLSGNKNLFCLAETALFNISKEEAISLLKMICENSQDDDEYDRMRYAEFIRDDLKDPPWAESVMPEEYK